MGDLLKTDKTQQRFSISPEEVVRISVEAMASVFETAPPAAGFQFDNVKRNSFLHDKAGVALPRAQKTGTTICGAVFDGGVVVGADTRATNGDIVADKNCQKIHPLAPNMVCCGAGTAADCDKVTNMIASQLKLLRLDWNRQVRVKTANHLFKQMLFRYQGHIGAYLVLAGADRDGGHLYSIAAHGSTDKTPYTANGSGMLAAMAVLETGWKPGMKEEDAKKLVRDAIAAGIINDMGSGSNVDIAVIKPGDDITYFRPYEVVVGDGKRKKEYTYAKGTTPLLSTKEVTIIDSSVIQVGGEAMEVI